MKLKAITQHAIFVIVCLATLAFIVSGCSHNPIVVTSGKRTNIGFDPGSLSASISWTDGLLAGSQSRRRVISENRGQ